MSFDLQLTNRRALVTGGTKGVGAAVVEVLREGWRESRHNGPIAPNSAGRWRALRCGRSLNG
jgi:hypothetical protein